MVGFAALTPPYAFGANLGASLPKSMKPVSLDDFFLRESPVGEEVRFDAHESGGLVVPSHVIREARRESPWNDVFPPGRFEIRQGFHPVEGRDKALHNPCRQAFRCGFDRNRSIDVEESWHPGQQDADLGVEVSIAPFGK